MPNISWDLSRRDYGEEQDWEHLDDYSVVVDGYAHLRHLDDEGNWTRSSLYTFDNVSSLVLKTKSIPKLKELFGFRALIAAPQEDEKIEFQLSNDGGTTWQYWNDTASAWWTATGAPNESTSCEMIDEHLSTFVLGARQLAVKVLLYPSTSGTYSPILFHVSFFGEYPFNYEEDLQRALKRHIDDNLRATRTAQVSVCGENVIVFPATVAIYEPVYVYDLTNDPNRTTNLFDSLVPCQPNSDEPIVEYHINLTDYANCTAEVEYAFAPPVIISTADTEYMEAPLPSLVLHFPRGDDAPLEFPGTKVYDVSVSQWKARERHAPMLIESRVDILAQTGSKLEALALDEAIRELFRRCNRYFRSVASHHYYAVTRFAGTTRNDVVREELRVRAGSITVVGHRWSPAYTEVPLTREIILTAGTVSTEDLEVVIDE